MKRKGIEYAIECCDDKGPMFGYYFDISNLCIYDNCHEKIVVVFIIMNVLEDTNVIPNINLHYL